MNVSMINETTKNASSNKKMRSDNVLAFLVIGAMPFLYGAATRLPFIYFVIHLDLHFHLDWLTIGFCVAAYQGSRVLTSSVSIKAPRMSHLLGTSLGLAGYLIVFLSDKDLIRPFVFGTAIIGFSETMSSMQKYAKDIYKLDPDRKKAQSMVKYQYASVMIGVMFAFSVGGFVYQYYHINGVAAFGITMEGLGLLSFLVFDSLYEMQEVNTSVSPSTDDSSSDSDNNAHRNQDVEKGSQCDSSRTKDTQDASGNMNITRTDPDENKLNTGEERNTDDSEEMEITFFHHSRDGNGEDPSKSDESLKFSDSIYITNNEPLFRDIEKGDLENPGSVYESCGNSDEASSSMMSINDSEHVASQDQIAVEETESSNKRLFRELEESEAEESSSIYESCASAEAASFVVDNEHVDANICEGSSSKGSSERSILTEFLHHANSHYPNSEIPATWLNWLLCVSFGIEALTIGYNLSIGPIFLLREFDKDTGIIGVLFAVGAASGSLAAIGVTCTTIGNKILRRIATSPFDLCFAMGGISVGVFVAAIPYFQAHVLGLILLMCFNDLGATILTELQASITTVSGYSMLGPLGQVVRRCLNVVTALTGPVLYGVFPRLPYLVAGGITLLWTIMLFIVFKVRREQSIESIVKESGKSKTAVKHRMSFGTAEVVKSMITGRPEKRVKTESGCIEVRRCENCKSILNSDVYCDQV